MKCYFPRNVVYPAQTSTYCILIGARAASRFISRPVPTSCEMAADFTELLTLFDFKLTFPANPCGFFLVINIAVLNQPPPRRFHHCNLFEQ